MTVRWAEVCRDEWIDYNGHMSEAFYVLVFGHATDAVLDAVGLDDAHRSATRTSVFTVEAHVRYLGQVSAGERLEVVSEIIGSSDKALRLWHELRVDGEVRATEEVAGLHVSTASGRVVPFPHPLREALAAAVTPPPTPAGGGITIR